MKVIFKKSQLKLNEANGASLPPKTVMNDGGKDDTSSLQSKISQTNQANHDGSDIVVPTNQFTNKIIPPSNEDMVTTMPNTSDAASKVAKMINSTNANDLPAMIRLQNGVERSGNLVEIATFKKKELDEFLNSI